MKQSLQLKMGQHLTMTPQLQQAIRLLQLSTLELKTEIQEALESNPMLESVEDAADGKSQNDKDWNEADSAQETQGKAGESDSSIESSGMMEGSEQSGDNLSASTESSDVQMSEIPTDLPVDSVWEDTYESILPASNNTGTENRVFDDQDNSSESLAEHLLWQMRLSKFSEKDTEIALAIIDGINDQGYLTLNRDEILRGVDEVFEVEFDEIEAVLHRIQRFDPVGVASRDLQQCLLVQLDHLDKETPWLAVAKAIVTEHMKLLGNRDYNRLMSRMKLSDDDLCQVIALIQSLNPRPGSVITSKPIEYIVPDVLVRKIDEKWVVELNPETMPKLRINSNYANMIKRVDNSSENNYLKNNLQEARWFLKSLRSRHETLLKVATCIVGRQQGFLDKGEEAMQALVLHDVAQEVEMHESTISRVTTRKFIHTPRGVFELKYFFSSHVGTASGGEQSATSIRAIIKKMIAAENLRKPLSDSKIANMLGEQGINVARRTVAKYRESISIPSSSERKRLI